jgi:hypothetical protein
VTTGDDESTFADVLNGLTFGGRRRRRARSRRAGTSAPAGGASTGRAPVGAAPVGGVPAGVASAGGVLRSVPADGSGPSAEPVGGPPWSVSTTGSGRAPDPTWLADRLGWMARNAQSVDHGPLTGSGAGEPRPYDRPGDHPGIGERHALGGRWLDADADSDELGGDAAIVRPYAWTRGRTRSSIELQVETLVSAIGVPGVGGPLEHRAIAELCQTAHSVAEVAAALAVPLGIAKVLVSDMAETGQLTVHRPAADGARAHYVLMERVLSGLRRL